MVGWIAWTNRAEAQTANGSPPQDLAAAVAGPKGPSDAPGLNKLDVNFLHAAVSAGGQLQTGNSKLFAATGTGSLELRRGADDFGVGLVGNYAESFVPGTPAAPMSTTTSAPTGTAGEWKRSTENVQGKVRYERYLVPVMSAFLQATGTHDRFLALTFRLNVDPGVKVLLIENPATALWAEAGYDFQFDDNNTDSNGIEQAGAGGAVVDSNGNPIQISRTDTIHSSRLFAGFHEAFNKEVQLGLGLEYLQGFGGSGTSPPPIPPGYTPATIDPQTIRVTGSRLNFNALFAANVGAGFSLGLGFTAKYNSEPLPTKGDLDTTTTVQLIYTLSSPPPKPPPPPPPCAPSPPPGAPPGGTPPPTLPPAGATTSPASAPSPAGATP